MLEMKMGLSIIHSLRLFIKIELVHDIHSFGQRACEIVSQRFFQFPLKTRTTVIDVNPVDLSIVDTGTFNLFLIP